MDKIKKPPECGGNGTKHCADIIEDAHDTILPWALMLAGRISASVSLSQRPAGERLAVRITPTMGWLASAGWDWCRVP